MNRLCLSAFLLAFCAQTAVGETNFLINTSFRGDGMGGALNWNLSKPLEGSIERRPGQGPAGKRLNNFVTELYKAPTKDGAAKFFNPREGWVYIGFDRVLHAFD